MTGAQASDRLGLWRFCEFQEAVYAISATEPYHTCATPCLPTRSTMQEENLKRLRELFDEVVHLPVAERTTRIAEIGRDEPTLVSPLKELLAADMDPATAFELFEAPSDDDLAGKTIGAYTLRRRVGVGGMGEVYAAERSDDSFEKQVALKLVRPGMNTDAVMERFLRERQILANLEHPNIARLYDGGRADDGRPFLVMEYVEGSPLTKHAWDNDMPVRERVRLFTNVVEAVRYAHGNLVVHRDLKPSNVLVTSDGTAKLLDFGIAKLLEEEAHELETRTAARMMTPAYASPEQLQGGAINTSTDIYSLGVILYEMLTGARPFDTAKLSPGEVESMILNQPPKAPSTAVTTTTAKFSGESSYSDLESLKTELKGDLDSIVLKTLRKEPAERYSSAEAFLEDIRRYLEGLPVEARKGDRSYRMRKFVSRHRWVVGAIAGLFALLTAFGLFMAQATSEARDERNVAESATSILEGLFASGDLQNSPDRRDTLRVADFIIESAERVREMEMQPRVKARLLGTLGRAQTGMARFDEAIPMLRESKAIQRQIYGAESLEDAVAGNDLLKALVTTGQLDEADSLAEQVYPVLAADQSQRILYAGLLGSMAESAFQQRDLSRADSLDKIAETIYRSNPELRSELSATLTNRGTIQAAMGDREKALALFRESIDLTRDEYGAQHPRYLRQLVDLSDALSNFGQIAPARAASIEALGGIREVYGEMHDLTAYALKIHGSILVTGGKSDTAAFVLGESAAIFSEVFGSQHPQTQEVNRLRGRALFLAKRYEEAEPLLRQGTIDQPRGSALFDYADLLLRTNRGEQGIEYMIQGIKNMEEMPGVNVLNVAIVNMRLGEAYLGVGQYTKTVEIIDNHMPILASTLPPDHQITRRVLGIKATAQKRMERFEDSEATYLQWYGLIKDATDNKRRQIPYVTDGLAELYEAWGRPEEATKYRTISEELRAESRAAQQKAPSP